MYLTSVDTFVTVESPFVISAVICVFVVGVNVFNVMSVVNTTVAPFAAALLYFVCVPFNLNSKVFVPSLFSYDFIESLSISNSSSKYTLQSFTLIVSIFSGNVILIFGFVYIVSSALSFSSVTLISTFSFFTIVDNLLLLVVMLAFCVGSVKSTFFVLSVLTISISEFFAVPVTDVFICVKLFNWFVLYSIFLAKAFVISNITFPSACGFDVFIVILFVLNGTKFTTILLSFTSVSLFIVASVVPVSFKIVISPFSPNTLSNSCFDIASVLL